MVTLSVVHMKMLLFVGLNLRPNKSANIFKVFTIILTKSTYPLEKIITSSANAIMNLFKWVGILETSKTKTALGALINLISIIKNS